MPMITADLSQAVVQANSPRVSGDHYASLRPDMGVKAATSQYLPLMLIHPRADAGAMERFRHAFPGDRYELPIGIAFGRAPFVFELPKGAPGMVLKAVPDRVGGKYIDDDAHGLLVWETAVAGTYPILIRATDQNGATITISFTLTVNAANWVTVDTSAAVNGTGTDASPFNTITALNGLQNTKLARFKTCVVDLTTRNAEMNGMAKVWVRAKGHSPVILQGLLGAPQGFLWANSSGCYFEGLIWKTNADRQVTGQLVCIESCDRTVFHNNIFDFENFPNTPTATNAAVIMTRRGGTCNYTYLSRNVFKNCPDRDYWLGYSSRYTLIEKNVVQDCVHKSGGGWGFYPKTDVSWLCMRGNRSAGVLNTSAFTRIDAYAGDFPEGIDYIEICYNSYREYGTSDTGRACVMLGYEIATAGKNVFIHHNNFYSHRGAALVTEGWANTGVVTLDKNVMVCGGVNVNGVHFKSPNPPAVNNTGYLAGNLASGILDANNFLTGAHLNKLGTVGAELA